MTNQPFPLFSTKDELVSYIHTISSSDYDRTRNFLDGKVTKLSPYITAGVISLQEIVDLVLINNSKRDSYKLIQELAWRDYFASVRQALRDDIFKPIKRPQFESEQLSGRELPAAILNATTGITALDEALRKLYDTGYLHNHERMWLASVICNIAGTDWLTGAKWMYYYLVDGDLNSNMLSWQWVAGTFSSKKYLANQENINKYSKINQFGSFLDVSYEELGLMVENQNIPEVLQETAPLELPNWEQLIIDSSRVFSDTAQIIREVKICTPHTISFGGEADRATIVFVDSEEYGRFPFGQKKLDFLLGLGNQLWFYGTKEELSKLVESSIIVPTQQRMFESLNQYYPSFFKFWDKAERLI
jgi:deoxyribodipyrimidine photo-lyase